MFSSFNTTIIFRPPGKITLFPVKHHIFYTEVAPAQQKTKNEREPAKKHEIAASEAQNRESSHNPNCDQ